MIPEPEATPAIAPTVWLRSGSKSVCAGAGMGVEERNDDENEERGAHGRRNLSDQSSETISTRAVAFRATNTFSMLYARFSGPRG